VLKRLVLRENTFILIAGLGIGTICAVIAILPALGARDGSLPMMRIGMLLAAVFATGLAAVWLAARSALRSR